MDEVDAWAFICAFLSKINISGVIHSISESVSTPTSIEYTSDENDEFIDANICNNH